MVSSELIFASSHNKIREMSDFINVVVTDLGNIILVTGHLPDPLPDFLDLEVMKLLGVVTFSWNGSGSWFKRAFNSENIWNLAAVLCKDFLIALTAGTVCTG
jgi:hypothetical protein